MRTKRDAEKHGYSDRFQETNRKKIEQERVRKKELQSEREREIKRALDREKYGKVTEGYARRDTQREKKKKRKREL